MNVSNKSKFIGVEVNTLVSDPWDFGTIHGVGPFLAKILEVDIDKNTGKVQGLLLQLKTPLIYQNIDCEYFIAKLRHETGEFESLLTNKEVNCNLTRISTDCATSTNPFNLNYWRGGVGLIVSLQKV
jgi:hypothetical protein